MRPRIWKWSAAALILARAAIGSPPPAPIASYKIHCRFDDAAKSIEGTELLTWTNTTSRAARTLQFHLYLNAFRNNRSSFFRESNGETRGQAAREGSWGSISIARASDASGNDLLSTFRYIAPDDGNTEDRTVGELDLPSPVPPGETIHVSIDFVSRLPRVIARSGYKGDFYFVAQWFPKIGVLQEKGWNCHQYHAHSEFFADFGNYDVSIDAPARFKGKIGGTGRLLEERDAPAGRVIEHFVQESVHDFAWTADPAYEVYNEHFEERGLTPVSITILCQPEHREVRARYFKAAKTALSAFGRRYSPYPYSVLTLVDPPWGAGAAGGMEYPTLISCGTSLFHPPGLWSPESVTIHEFGHQYFYGLLASNEFEEAWLDEGFTTYAQQKVLAEAYGETHPSFSIFGYPVVFPSIAVRPPIDTQIAYFDFPTRDPLTASWKFEDVRSYRLVYNRTALSLGTFERIVGSHTMDAVMREYVETFRFRHPSTDDFVAVVNRVTGRDWTAFFRSVFFSAGSVDFAVASATSKPSVAPVGWLDREGRAVEVARRTAEKRSGFDSEVTVERRGDLALPVEVLLHFDNGRSWTGTWDGAARWVRFRVENGPKLHEAIVDPEEKILLDENRNNNGLLVGSDAAAANLWTARAFFWAENLIDLFMELW